MTDAERLCEISLHHCNQASAQDDLHAIAKRIDAKDKRIEKLEVVRNAAEYFFEKHCIESVYSRQLSNALAAAKEPTK